MSEWLVWLENVVNALLSHLARIADELQRIADASEQTVEEEEQ